MRPVRDTVYFALGNFIILYLSHIILLQVYNFYVVRLGQGLPCPEVFGPSLEPLLRLARIILSLN